MKSIHRHSAVRPIGAVALTVAVVLGSRTVQAALPPGNTVQQWNKIAEDTVVGSGAFQNEGLIYMAYVSAAVYDAVVAIEGRYQPYGHDIIAPPGASIDAAVVEAAYRTLRNYFLAQAATLDALHAEALALIPDGLAKIDGRAIGITAADGIIALRSGDGLMTPIGVSSTFETAPPAPGVWRLTPPFALPQTPWVGSVQPFILKKPGQFQPRQPAPLASQQWVDQFSEIKMYGRDTGSARTPEQTAVARFWTANVIRQYNRVARDIASGRGLSLLDSARLAAMTNVVGADAQMSVMNSKYQFLFWRPVTAIDPTAVIADGFGPVPGFDDENERTVEETGWRPLITTPNHPEYPGAHGSITSAMAEVLGEFLGTEQIDVDIHGFDATGTTGNLDAVRHFDSTERLRSEIIEARLWAGLHYRGSSEAGVDLGRKVARYDLNHAFRTRAASAKVRIPRIRSDSTMTALIAQASERSATFRRFVNLIDATDGIVYLERGRCRYKMRACLLATVTMAGPNRILRIMIDQRQAECDLNQMASIGHELWHAIEVLREPSIRSDSAFFFFYLREGLHTNRLEYPLGAWETPAADKAGVDVLAELRKGSPEKGEPCAHR